jgi:hypothetical protein
VRRRLSRAARCFAAFAHNKQPPPRPLTPPQRPAQAQLLTRRAAKLLLGSVPHKPGDAPVMFFSTREIAWIGERDLFRWGDGMAQQLHVKGRKNKKFATALEQVRWKAWWCRF